VAFVSKSSFSDETVFGGSLFSCSSIGVSGGSSILSIVGCWYSSFDPELSVMMCLALVWGLAFRVPD